MAVSARLRPAFDTSGNALLLPAYAESGGVINGALSVTLDAVTVSSSGALQISGSASASLDVLLAAGTGAVAVQGALAQTIGGVSAASAAALSVQGAVATRWASSRSTALAACQ